MKGSSRLPTRVMKTLHVLALLSLSVFVVSCGIGHDRNRSEMLVSVADQKMLLSQRGQPVKVYPVSTSKFGLGDVPKSKCTPLGTMKVARKFGDGAVPGTVYKSRKPTGEILKPDAPGRDPIVTRILWLRGTEEQNRNAFDRYIYIHGTPEERTIGSATSYGCIRMKSHDVIDLYNRVGINASVTVVTQPLSQTEAGRLYDQAIQTQQAAATAQ